MIARDDYAGPITKSAEAMFARAERKAQRAAGPNERPSRQAMTPASCFGQVVQDMGLSLATVRGWENAGLIEFGRRRGRRMIDDATIEHLAMVARLREAGFSIREIAWTCDTLPPNVAALQSALQSHLDGRRQPAKRPPARSAASSLSTHDRHPQPAPGGRRQPTPTRSSTAWLSACFDSTFLLYISLNAVADYVILQPAKALILFAFLTSNPRDGRPNWLT